MELNRCGMEEVKTHKLIMMSNLISILKCITTIQIMMMMISKEEEVGGQCSGGEGEEAVAKKFVEIIHNLKI